MNVIRQDKNREVISEEDSNLKVKQIIKILLVICLTLSLSGCVKCIDTRYEDVEARIVDEYYQGAYSTPMRVGDIFTVISHPEEYRITVEYEGIQYVIEGQSTYEKCKDHIGELVNVVMEIRKYDNGHISYKAVKIK